MWHRREKATIDQVARAVGFEQKTSTAGLHSAFTATGLAVEDQVRKAWQPCTAGLAVF
jgi:hypothetical protein